MALTYIKEMYILAAGPWLFSLRLLEFCWHKGLPGSVGLCSWEVQQQNFIVLWHL